ncbi:MAG TPA: hypothetical protein VFA52_03915 [Candidatus Paceibacterota bacterium]|nr:hypothetical protein [Candidatus Paceibacterota bacterium]
MAFKYDEFDIAAIEKTFDEVTDQDVKDAVENIQHELGEHGIWGEAFPVTTEGNIDFEKGNFRLLSPNIKTVSHVYELARRLEEKYPQYQVVIEQLQEYNTLRFTVLKREQTNATS